MTPRKMHLSKFLSFVLRHKPEEIGIQLDEAGWAEVEALLQGLRLRLQNDGRRAGRGLRTNPSVVSLLTIARRGFGRTKDTQ